MKRLIDGLELLGKTKDSGYKNAVYLLRTPNNQYIEVTELLYQTIEALQTASSEHDVATNISKQQQKEVDVQAVRFLIEKRIAPLGILKESNTIFQSPKLQKPAQFVTPRDRLLSLRYRMTLLPQRMVQKITPFFHPFFAPIIVVAVLFDFLLLNIWLFGFHGVHGALQLTLYQPFLFVLLFSLILLGMLFHEIGHATATSYGGAKPGRIGAGMYLVWPAFFTDITDVYRFGRKEKLRSDVGGIYFNCVFALLIAGVYFVTGFEPLLLLIALQNLTMIHQLLPFVRMDGYFIISDLVGLPDLFMRMGPIVKGVFTRQKNAATKDLKRWVKWTVTAWVTLTIPVLLLLLIALMASAPFIITTALQSAQIHSQIIMDSITQGNYFVATIRLLQLALLLLPALGIIVVLSLLGKQLLRVMQRRRRNVQPMHMQTSMLRFK